MLSLLAGRRRLPLPRRQAPASTASSTTRASRTRRCRARACAPGAVARAQLPVRRRAVRRLWRAGDDARDLRERAGGRRVRGRRRPLLLRRRHLLAGGRRRLRELQGAAPPTPPAAQRRRSSERGSTPTTRCSPSAGTPATKRKYWIAQNTWGPRGRRGFFRIARGADESALRAWPSPPTSSPARAAVSCTCGRRRACNRPPRRTPQAPRRPPYSTRARPAAAPPVTRVLVETTLKVS